MHTNDNKRPMSAFGEMLFTAISGSNMAHALKAVREMPPNVVHVAKPFDPWEDNEAWSAYRYPEQYYLIKGVTPDKNILVDKKDKHAWVEESKVIIIRDYYARMAEEQDAR